MTKKGIDVSKWQGTINWEKVKAAGIEFAMIRLGYGSSVGDNCKIDPFFAINMDGALAVGIGVGVYFYSYALTLEAAAKEANFVVEELVAYKEKISYPVAYDLEDRSQRDLGRIILTAMVKIFCSVIEKAGYYPSFYANLDWCRNRLDMEALKAYDIWLAHWSSSASTAYPHGMWQYTNNGSVAGIKGNVDMNIAYKDYPAITGNFTSEPKDPFEEDRLWAMEQGITDGSDPDRPALRKEVWAMLRRMNEGG